MNKENNNNTSKEKKVSPKWSVFFIATWFLVIGIILFYTPEYIGVEGIVQKIIIFGAWIAIIVSLIGSFIELSNILKNEGFAYLGTSLIFIIPAILLHVYQSKNLSRVSLITTLKTIAILLILVGSGILLYGFSFFLERESKKSEANTDKKINIELIVSLIIALLTLATAIIQL